MNISHRNETRFSYANMAENMVVGTVIHTTMLFIHNTRNSIRSASNVGLLSWVTRRCSEHQERYDNTRTSDGSWWFIIVKNKYSNGLSEFYRGFFQKITGLELHPVDKDSFGQEMLLILHKPSWEVFQHCSPSKHSSRLHASLESFWYAQTESTHNHPFVVDKIRCFVGRPLHN